MGEIIGIVSGKGGVGKTTIAANLGIAMVELGEDIVVVDGDLGSASLGFQLGRYRTSQALHEIIEKDKATNKNILIHHSGLRIIPASIHPEIVDFHPDDLNSKLKSLGNLILLDSPPGFDRHAKNILKVCDSIIIVANPELSSITEAMKISHMAKEFGKEVKGVILNRMGYSKHDLTMAEIEGGCDLSIIGTIPEDKEVKKSFFRGEPLLSLNPYSKASLAYKEIAARILKREHKAPRAAFLRRWKNRIS